VCWQSERHQSKQREPGKKTLEPKESHPALRTRCGVSLSWVAAKLINCAKTFDTAPRVSYKWSTEVSRFPFSPAATPHLISVAMASQMPASMPPDENRGPIFLAAITPLFVVAILLYSARVYSRLRPVVNIMWDDYAMAAGMVSCIRAKTKAYSGRSSPPPCTPSWS
jgi:hypothetical protein